MRTTDQKGRSKSRSLLTERRASERVMDYLLTEFDRPELKNGTRLPPIRELAEHLKVSVRTAHAAVQKLAREGRLRTEHGSGTYLVQTGRVKTDRLTFAVGMPIPGSALDNPWHNGIYGGMLTAALRSPVPISFLPACRQSALDEDVGRALLEQRPHADGLILFPFHRLTDLYEEVRSAYERDGKPVVTFNPPSESATTNFVSPDYLAASHRLGKVWKQTGRRHVFLIGALFKASVSARLRWAGLNNAFGTDLGDTVSCRAVGDLQLNPVMEESVYLTVKDILAKGTTMDAVYTVGDYGALGVLRAVCEAGLRVPEDVSVVGGTGIGLTGSACPQLTRMWQPLATIGEKLVEMLVQRIEHGQRENSSMSGIFLPTPFVGGATTRATENEALGIRSNATI